MASKDQAIEEMQSMIIKLCANYIALVCSEPGCDVAKVIPRYPSDHPTATSMQLPCAKHEGDGEGHIPYYFDEDGNEVSGDPEEWRK